MFKAHPASSVLVHAEGNDSVWRIFAKNCPLEWRVIAKK